METSEYIALGWDVARSKGYDGSDFESNSELNSVLWDIYRDHKEKVQNGTRGQVRDLLRAELEVA